MYNCPQNRHASYPHWAQGLVKDKAVYVGINRRQWFDGEKIQGVWEFIAGHLKQTRLDREGLSREVLSKLEPEGEIVIVWQSKGEENARQHVQKSVVKGELGGFKELEQTQLDCKGRHWWGVRQWDGSSYSDGINRFGPYPKSSSNPLKCFRLKKWSDRIYFRKSALEWNGDEVRQSQDHRQEDDSESCCDNEMKDSGSWV